MRIAQDFFDDAITPGRFGIGQPKKQAAFFRIFNFVFEVAALFMAKALAIRDEELEVACVWNIDVRIVNLIDDTMAEREPDAAARVVSRADSFLRARGPTRLNTGRAKGCRWIHER